MDPSRFDSFARVLAGTPTRRGALAGLLAALNFAATDGDADAKPESPGNGGSRDGGKGHGRNRGNGHGNGNGRNRKGQRGCDSKPTAAVCRGACGPLQDNCGRRIDCPPCTCGDACPACQVRNPRTDLCAADPTPDGACCAGGAGVCAAGVCGLCANNGRCNGGVCTCTPLTECPADAQCGTIANGCGGELNRGSCANPTPICADNVCAACTTSDQCASGDLCDRGSCVTGSGTCAAGANACLAFESCNGNPDCFCLPARAGATRCARYYQEGANGFLRPCAADADCGDLGAGAFCPPQFDSCGGVCSLPC
jgi:hypothetical protein